MRFLTLILASIFAFGMPEVRANESLEESLEVVVNYTSGQTAISKRTTRALPATPKAITPPVTLARPLPSLPGPVTKSLFLEHRVLRL